jgi:hypothetical protein
MKTKTILLVAVFCAVSIPASALVTYNFTGITNNDPGDVAIGEAQLFLDVEDPGGGQVLFTLYNTGPEASSIAGIYVEDGDYLSSLASIDNSDPGVSFVSGGAPPVLPGGNEADPAFAPSFRATATAPPSGNGVNPGESVGLLFDLQGGVTYADITSAITNGDLRVGIHVIAFASGGSESFVTTVIPAPGAIILGSIGSLAVAGIRTLRNRKKH